MNKLYHYFYVSSYKGGELHYNLNCTIKDVARSVIHEIFWDDLMDEYGAYDVFNDTSSEEWETLTHVEFLDKLDDDIIEDIAFDIVYPGNDYAFDACSDTKVFTLSDQGKLQEIYNVVKEPGFMEAFKELLYKEAKRTDKLNKQNA